MDAELAGLTRHYVTFLNPCLNVVLWKFSVGYITALGRYKYILCRDFIHTPFSICSISCRILVGFFIHECSVQETVNCRKDLVGDIGALAYLTRSTSFPLRRSAALHRFAARKLSVGSSF